MIIAIGVEIKSLDEAEVLYRFFESEDAYLQHMMYIKDIENEPEKAVEYEKCCWLINAQVIEVPSSL